MGTGSLTLVGTPIGNLGDLSPRAVEAVRAADLIACESPQAASRLLSYLGVSKRLTSYRESNRDRATPELLEKLREGCRLVFLSEAGMPGVSDPGRTLVEACHLAQVPVTCVPGASALTCALALCGLPTRRFVFEGFLPRKGAERRRVLDDLRSEPRAIVLFEAPHRLKRTLRDLREVLGARRIFVGRELTKKFEEASLSTLDEAIADFEEREPRGEFVLVVEPPEQAKAEAEPLPEGAVEWLLEQGLGARQAAAVLARFWDISRKDAYRLAARTNVRRPEEQPADR